MKYFDKAIHFFRELVNSLWVRAMCALVALGTMVSLAESYYAHTRTQAVAINIRGQAGFHFVEQRGIKDKLQNHLPAALHQYTLNELPLADLEDMLEHKPHVAGAEVYMDVAGKLLAHVRQREPTVRIINNEQESFYLDKQGKRMPFSPAYEKPLVTASGAIKASATGDLSDSEAQTLEAIQRVSQHIRQDSFLRALTGQVYIAPNQDIQLIPRIGEQTIVLGQAQNLPDRFNKLKAFYQKVLPSKGWYTYERINLKYEKQIVAKK